jgi:hypothetical protein
MKANGTVTDRPHGNFAELSQLMYWASEVLHFLNDSSLSESDRERLHAAIGESQEVLKRALAGP